MIRLFRLGFPALFLFCMHSVASAASFAYGFRGCPESVSGLPGTVVRVTVFGTITTADNPTEEGAIGWSVSLAVEGAEVAEAVLRGVEVLTVYFDDVDDDPSTTDDIVRLDPYVQDLGAPDVHTKVLSRLRPSAASPQAGLISAVVMKAYEKQTLQPSGTQDIVRIVLEVTVPPEGCIPVKLEFRDGLAMCPTCQPVRNIVVWPEDGTRSIAPALSTCSFEVCAGVPSEEFQLAVVPLGQLPAPEGDTQLDGVVPAGDHLLETEVLLTTANLPGGDGPTAWSLSVRNDPCVTVEAVELNGIVVPTIVYDDLDDDSFTTDDVVRKENIALDLGAPEVFAKLAEKAGGPGAAGAVSVIMLDGGIDRRMLPANASDRVLRIVYRVPVAAGEETRCRVWLADGLLTSLEEPVKNEICYDGGGGVRCLPAMKTQGLDIRLTGERPPPGFLSGECNGDGSIDITDAVFSLDFLFRAGSEGSCLAACDAQGDGVVDITDAVYTLGFLFTDGLPPTAPWPNCAPHGSTLPCVRSCP